MPIKHYVEFRYPGSFVAEDSSRPAVDGPLPTKIPKRAIGWRVWSRVEGELEGAPVVGPRIDVSPWTYIGKVLTVADVERMPMPENEILLENMRGSGTNRVVDTGRMTLSIDDDDTVVPESSIVREA